MVHYGMKYQYLYRASIRRYYHFYSDTTFQVHNLQKSFSFDVS